MARTPISNKHQLLISDLRRNGMSIDKIELEMHRLWGLKSIDKPPARRTIAKYAGKFDRLEMSVKLNDLPFQWCSLDEYDLPWESSAYILEMWRFVMSGELFATKVGDHEEIPVPTVRQVRWWWRIHLADAELQMGDVWRIGQRFANRELGRDLLNIPLDTSDLEAHIAYKPWQDEGKNRLYQRDIEEGKIPCLKLDQDAVNIFAPCDLLEDFVDPRTVGLAALGIREKEFIHLLPSQQLELVRERSQRINTHRRKN